MIYRQNCFPAFASNNLFSIDLISLTDTPQHIYDLQLKLWLEKSPGERLYRQLVDNDALYRFWNNAKPAADNSNKLINTKNALDGVDANLNAVKK